MSDIIEEAIKNYKPKNVALLFSGGHDSLCSTHYAASYLDSIGVPFTVYHGNTGIGIRQTREFVYEVVKTFGWKFYEGHPPKGSTYEELVVKYGFPGPTKRSHQIMFRHLKERAIMHYVTHVCKPSPNARHNVLLISGVRQSESAIRMGYTEHITKHDSRIWTNPIFYWSEDDCKNYMQEHNLPRNPVKDKICISGECLCGTFALNEEYAEIKASYPEAAAEIDRLHKLASDNGFPWGWASGPTEHYKKFPDQGKPKMFMCIGCEAKREVIT